MGRMGNCMYSMWQPYRALAVVQLANAKPQLAPLTVLQHDVHRDVILVCPDNGCDVQGALEPSEDCNLALDVVQMRCLVLNGDIGDVQLFPDTLAGVLLACLLVCCQQYFSKATLSQGLAKCVSEGARTDSEISSQTSISSAGRV